MYQLAKVLTVLLVYWSSTVQVHRCGTDVKVHCSSIDGDACHHRIMN